MLIYSLLSFYILFAVDILHWNIFLETLAVLQGDGTLLFILYDILTFAYTLN